MSTKTVTAKKATKPSHIDYHGFVASTKKSKDWADNYSITPARGREIAVLLGTWIPDPANVNVADAAKNVSTLPTENERLFASFCLGGAIAMAGMTNGLVGGIGDAAPETGDDNPDAGFPGADDDLN